MSQANADAVRAIYDEWAKGNFRAGAELYDRHAVLVQGEGFPEKGAYLGPEGIRDYMHRFLEAWEWVTIEAEEIEAAGDSVVAGVLQLASGKESGAPGEFRYWQVWSFRGPKIIRLETFRERDDAFAAAGRGV
jgi:ketosteroid isomerase-like protein